MSTDTAPLARARSRRPFLIGGFVLVVLALAGLGHACADGRADDYTKDFEAWQARQGAELVSTSARIPTKTFVGAGSFNSLYDQRTGCDAVERIARDAPLLGEKIPTVSAGIGGLFSGRLRDAASTSRERSFAVRSFARKVAKVFEQVHRDCSWNITHHAPTDAKEKAWDLYEKSEKYLDRRGPTGPGAVCRLDECIAYEKSDRLKYAAIVSEAYDLEWKISRKSYSRGCSDTSYGDAMCKALVTVTDRYRATRQNYATVVRKAMNSVDNPVFDEANAAWRDVEKRNAALLESALRKEHPSLAADKKLASNPAVTDRFFSLADGALVKALAADRAKIADL